jgi:hypothetical protein
MAVRHIAELARFKRRDNKELRLQVHEYVSDEGAAHRFVAIEMWQGDENLKKGATVRRGELRALITALEKADELIDGSALETRDMSLADYAKTLEWGSVPESCMSYEELQEVIRKAREAFPVK